MPASRSRVLSSCLGTAASLAVIGALLRAYAARAGAGAAAALGADPAALDALLSLPAGFGTPTDAAVVAAGVVGVTGARLALLGAWPEFREATDASNRQVLTNLNWTDVALVSAATGASEELLFRGGLLPAACPDWRGALLAGAVFGLLHNSGGRNASFAAWAGGVGVLYGGAYLYTQNLWVPIAMHVLNNGASAAAWLAGRATASAAAAAAAADEGGEGRRG
jgi:membrane protease YdiL (CAAX protease family)